ncbi:uncharacterized protein LOC116419992 [Sarcophilus harrisii]|uniref:uncharacterized protein LOC116419992 n=1 Tax=Sarcophilus harrisii TaxID=9305 RepID=UPI00130209A2|nr:uncharacterized protein LOC116419992 [Sarcophilus harrisii]
MEDATPSSPHLLTKSVQFPSISGPAISREVSENPLPSNLSSMIKSMEEERPSGLLALNKSVQLPSFSGPSPSAPIAEVPSFSALSSSKESTKLLISASKSIQFHSFSDSVPASKFVIGPFPPDSSSSREHIDVPSFGSIAISKSLQVSFLISSLVKEYIESPSLLRLNSGPKVKKDHSPSVPILSKESRGAHFSYSLISENKGMQVPHVEIFFSDKAIQIPSICEIHLVNDSAEVLCAFSSSQSGEFIQYPIAVRIILESKSMQVPFSAAIFSSSKSIKFSCYSEISMTQYTQGLSFFDSMSSECMEVQSFSVPLSSNKSIQIPYFPESKSLKEDIYFLSTYHTIAVNKLMKVCFFSDISPSSPHREVTALPGPLLSRESKFPLNFVAILSLRLIRFPSFSDLSSSDTCTQELPSLRVTVSSQESRNVCTFSETNSLTEAAAVPSTYGGLIFAKSTRVSFIFVLSSSIVVTEKFISFPDSLLSKESIEHNSNFVINSLSKHTHIPSISYPSLLNVNTEVSSFLLPFYPIESRQFSDSSDSLLLRKDKQMYSINGPVSDRQCTQISHSSNKSLPTEILQLLREKTNLPSSHRSVSVRQFTQTSHFSDKCLPTENLQILSIDFDVRVSNLTQLSSLSDASSSNECIKEVIPFPVPLKLRESNLSNLGVNSGNKLTQILFIFDPSSLHMNTPSSFLLPFYPIESRKFSDFSLMSLLRENMQIPSILGTISVNKCTVFSHSFDKRLPIETLQVPSTLLVITVSKSILQPSFSRTSSSTVCVRKVLCLACSLLPRESFQNPSNLGVISVIKLTKFPSFSDPSSMNAKTEIIFFLLPFCPKESKHFSDFSDTMPPRENVQIPSILGSLSMSKCTQFSHISDKSLPTGTLQPSTHLAVTVNKLMQHTLFFDESSLAVSIEEVIPFPSLPKSKESIQHPSNFGDMLVSKSVQFSSSSVLSSLNINIKVVSSFLLPLCPKESRKFFDFLNMSFSGENRQILSILGLMTVSIDTQFSHYCKKTLPTETLKVPSINPAVTESKPIQPTYFSDMSFLDSLKSKESIQHLSKFGGISVNKSTQFFSFFVPSSLNVNTEEVPSFLLPFCQTESKHFSDFDTSLLKDDTQRLSILAPISVSKCT